MLRWPILVPPAAAALLVAAMLLPVGTGLAIACGLGLVASVLVSVHHAEVVAHRVGEPFGTLVLAIAITVIEVALIVSMTLAGGPEVASLARDTIFATIMIIANGVVGICVVAGALRHREQVFRIEGAGPALAALIAMSTLTLVMPGLTTSAPGPYYTVAQLAFAAISSVTLWGVFVFVQTMRHRDYFLPVIDVMNEEVHAEPPTRGRAWASLGLLLVSLVTVVGLAKMLSPTIEAAVLGVGAPPAVIGIAIAMMVLMPETWAALRAALINRIQTSMNLALGSALASIGLTIPVVAATSIAFDIPLVLGLEPKDIAMLVLTFVVGAITLGSGRTTLMQGAVHLVIFAAFLFLAFVP